MKKLIVFIALQLIIYPLGLRANENFSVEIEALTLVMKQYEKYNESEIKSILSDENPTYIALKQDECNATVRVTEKAGVDIVNIESFDVNICKKKITKL